MFRVVGSKSSYSSCSRAATIGCGRTTLGRRVGASRRGVSNHASGGTTMAPRSWRGQHQQFVNDTGGTITRRRTTIRSALSQTRGGTQRSFFSPSQQEQPGSPRFSPLEEFLMDAMAWTVAFSLWYILNMEVSEDDLLGENCDEDHNDDRVLEYREDYGPTVSQSPSSPSPENSTRRKTPKNDSKPKEGKQNE